MGLLDALKQYVSDSMPGGLLNPEFNSTNGQKLAAELNAGLLESTGINARDKRRAWNKNQLDAVSGSSDTRGSLDKQAYETAMNMAGMAPMGLTVWHGSPHKFSKFDMSKIGTGEGAQAYGHGLYMAEAPDVAKTYADTLGEEVLVKGKPVYKAHNNTIAGDAPIGNAARNALQGSNWDLAKAKSAMQDAYKTSGDGYFKRALDELSALSESDITRKTGSIYKVDIPDEAVARMLDWDKPLSQQAPEVQKALSNTNNKKLRAMVEYANVPYSEMAGGEVKTMGEAFRLLNLNLQGKASADSAKASALLAKQGIPGIRYLDGGSRSAGQGSYNFVLFDDQLPRILETNGVPTGQAPWAPGEWKGLLGK